MTILACVKDIQARMILIPGIKTAPDYPGPGTFPLVITHLGTGTITGGNPAGARTELNNVIIELHVSDSGLTSSFKVLETLHPLVIIELCADPTFSGTIQTYGDITYATLRTEWDGAPTLARIYTLLNCKNIA